MSEENKAAEQAEAATETAAFDSKELGIVGKKVGMTQIFDSEGNAVPVTVVELGENVVTAVKTKEKDGYDAVQIGNFEAKEKHLTRGEINHLKKQGLGLFRFLQEFRTPDPLTVKSGDKVDAVKFFEDLKHVRITAKSIGKGFQGGVKLHNFSDGRKTHGSKSHRQIGSLGAGTDPSRVFKGKRMPSMMGNRIVTLNKVEIVKFDADKNVVLIRGPVPGKKGTTVTLKAAGLKTWNHYNKRSA